MYSLLLAPTVIAAFALASVDPTAAQNSQPGASIPQAPIGHLQPRRRISLPVRAEQVEQLRCWPSMPNRKNLIRNSTGAKMQAPR